MTSLFRARWELHRLHAYTGPPRYTLNTRPIVPRAQTFNENAAPTHTQVGATPLLQQRSWLLPSLEVHVTREHLGVRHQFPLALTVACLPQHL